MTLKYGPVYLEHIFLGRDFASQVRRLYIITMLLAIISYDKHFHGNILLSAGDCQLRHSTTVYLNDAPNVFVSCRVIFLSLLSCKKSLFPLLRTFPASLSAWKTKKVSTSHKWKIDKIKNIYSSNYEKKIICSIFQPTHG